MPADMGPPRHAGREVTQSAQARCTVFVRLSSSSVHDYVHKYVCSRENALLSALEQRSINIIGYLS